MRMHHTLRRHWMTPNALTRGRVMCSVFGLSPPNCWDLFCFLCFRNDCTMTKRKSSATNACRAPISKRQLGNVVRFHFSFGWQNWAGTIGGLRVDLPVVSGANRPEAAVVTANFLGRQNTGAGKLRFVRRFASCVARARPQGKNHLDLQALAQFCCLARRHQRFVQFVHDTELQTLHVTVLELERGRLEPKLADPLSICSNVFSRILIQLLHPNGKCKTHWLCTGSTIRVNRQVDSVAQRPLHWHQILRSCRSSIDEPLVFGFSPRLANLAGCTFHVG